MLLFNLIVELKNFNLNKSLVFFLSKKFSSLNSSVFTFHTLNVRTTYRTMRREYNLTGIPGEEFPEMPIIDSDRTFSIGSDILKKMIAGTIFSVSANDTKPVFLQIKSWLEDNILRGDWSAGAQLPSVRELAAEFGVNPNTVARTYERLSLEGTVISTRGVGFFVAEQAYDNIIPKILTDKFGLSQVISGMVMALDNVLAVILLPIFGAFSDKTKTKFGKLRPYLLFSPFLIMSAGPYGQSVLTTGRPLRMASISTIGSPSVLEQSRSIALFAYMPAISDT